MTLSSSKHEAGIVIIRALLRSHNEMKRHSTKFKKLNSSSIQITLPATLPKIRPTKRNLFEQT